MLYLIINLLSASCVVFVYEIEPVPTEVHGLFVDLGFSISVECLIHKIIDIQVNTWLETLSLHAWSTKISINKRY